MRHATAQSSATSVSTIPSDSITSRLVMKGVPLLEVSKLLGHGFLAMTIR